MILTPTDPRENVEDAQKSAITPTWCRMLQLTCSLLPHAAHGISVYWAPGLFFLQNNNIHSLMHVFIHSTNIY